jgi:hypothetical protein
MTSDLTRIVIAIALMVAAGIHTVYGNYVASACFWIAAGIWSHE